MGNWSLVSVLLVLYWGSMLVDNWSLMGVLVGRCLMLVLVLLMDGSGLNLLVLDGSSVRVLLGVLVVLNGSRSRVNVLLVLVVLLGWSGSSLGVMVLGGLLVGGLVAVGWLVDGWSVGLGLSIGEGVAGRLMVRLMDGVLVCWCLVVGLLVNSWGSVLDGLLVHSWGNILDGLLVDGWCNIFDGLLVNGWSNVLDGLLVKSGSNVLVLDDWRYGMLVMVLRSLLLVLYLFVRHFVSLKWLLGLVLMVLMVSTVVSTGVSRMAGSVNNSGAGKSRSAGQNDDKLMSKRNKKH